MRTTRLRSAERDAEDPQEGPIPQERPIPQDQLIFTIEVQLQQMART